MRSIPCAAAWSREGSAASTATFTVVRSININRTKTEPRLGRLVGALVLRLNINDATTVRREPRMFIAAGVDDGFHGGHSHRRHRGHVEGHGYVSSRDRFPILACELHANRIAALVRRIGISRQFHIRLLLCGSIHRSCLTSTGRGGNKRSGGSLQLGFGINQEVGRSDDLFLCLYALRDHQLIADLRPQLDFTRLNAPFAFVDE